VLLVLALAVGSRWLATPALAQDGAYRIEPWEGLYNDVRIQWWDQKIVAAGQATADGTMAIGRYDSDGVPDDVYGSGGVAGLAGYANGLTLQADGKAVVAGSLNSVFGVARFNTDGTLDDSFGSGGRVSFSIPGMESPYSANGVGVQSTGKIVVAGFANPSSGSIETAAVMARFTASGALDSGKGNFGDVKKGKPVGYTVNTFFGAANSSFRKLAIQPVDDKIVAPATARLARYTAAGALEGSVSYPYPPVFGGQSSALQGDGKIVVPGYALGIDGSVDMSITRYNANGTLDTTFGGGNGYVQVDIDGTASTTGESGSDVAIQPDGKIVAVGSVGAGVNSVLVVRLNSDGTLDETFGTGGIKLGSPPEGYASFGGSAVDLQLDGTIIVVGAAGTVGGEIYPLVMRFDL
jgi:uncharacterized delta-60 repeat protein